MVNYSNTPPTIFIEEKKNLGHKRKTPETESISGVHVIKKTNQTNAFLNFWRLPAFFIFSFPKGDCLGRIGYMTITWITL